MLRFVAVPRCHSVYSVMTFTVYTVQCTQSVTHQHIHFPPNTLNHPPFSDFELTTNSPFPINLVTSRDDHSVRIGLYLHLWLYRDSIVVIGGLVAEDGVVGSVLLYNTTSKVIPVEIITSFLKMPDAWCHRFGPWFSRLVRLSHAISS